MLLSEILNENEEWAETEFGSAELGDSRRTARLVELARQLGSQPTASLPQACSDEAMLKGAYRFFSNEAISPPILLESHIEATHLRCQKVPLVLAPQDTTYLDWTHHPATTGLGPLVSEKQQGLVVHNTLALTPERVPLGLLRQEVWARDAETFAKKEDQRKRPINEKESQKWLNGLEAVNRASIACPDTHFVCMGDRESDLYDLFVAKREANVGLLVRAAQDRRVEGEHKKVWETVEAAPVVGTVEIKVPKRGKQAARLATVAIRFCKITLLPPKHRSSEKLKAVTLTAVLAQETEPPAEVEKLEWLLLTTCSVENVEGALEKVAWYACRWTIEVWHKVLKSGCQIEAKQLETREGLERCLSLYSVIAWRILYSSLLARSVPNAPCTVLLEREEWEALYCVTHKTPTPPTQPPTLEEAILWIGQLGGFLARKGDGKPGVTVLWRGFQRLADLTAMYHIMQPATLSKLTIP
jgi:hypothetical protein